MTKKNQNHTLSGRRLELTGLESVAAYLRRPIRHIVEKSYFDAACAKRAVDMMACATGVPYGEITKDHFLVPVAKSKPLQALAAALWVAYRTTGGPSATVGAPFRVSAKNVNKLRAKFDESLTRKTWAPHLLDLMVAYADRELNPARAEATPKKRAAVSLAENTRAAGERTGPMLHATPNSPDAMGGVFLF